MLLHEVSLVSAPCAHDSEVVALLLSGFLSQRTVVKHLHASISEKPLSRPSGFGGKYRHQSVPSSANRNALGRSILMSQLPCKFDPNYSPTNNYYRLGFLEPLVLLEKPISPISNGYRTLVLDRLCIGKPSANH